MRSAHSFAFELTGFASILVSFMTVAWIGRRVEVRETKDKVEIELDARHIVAQVRSIYENPDVISDIARFIRGHLDDTPPPSPQLDSGMISGPVFLPPSLSGTAALDGLAA